MISIEKRGTLLQIRFFYYPCISVILIIETCADTLSWRICIALENFLLTRLVLNYIDLPFCLN